MATQGFQQVQKQTQSMVLAPQLRQSLKILQVPALELRSTIIEELEANPTLEELPYDDVSLDADSEDKSDGESPASEFEEKEVLEKDVPDSSERVDFSDEYAILERMGDEWKEYWNEEAGEIPYNSEAAQKRQHFFDSLTTTPSFQEALLEQARLTEPDESTISALEFILGSLDDNGFLTTSASDLALMARVPLSVMQKGIDLLKSMEPAGIGARNVQDSLLLQLERIGQQKSLAAEIIQKQWKLLLRRRVPEIARALKAKPSEVEIAIEQISQLDPAPAKRFSDDNNQVVTADVTVMKDDRGEWQIILNSDYIPRLRISSSYKQMLAQGKLKGKDREYLQNMFRSGRFLISAIEQRQQTIERITRELLKFQSDFFEQGKSKLRPLTMNQIAESVGVHETTVSRAIANKYIQTPHGFYEMKFFFTPGYHGEDGEEVSNKSIKDRIARIVDNELPKKPLSDQKIVEILKGEGITIARRTVAKYRDELGILPTNLRRQYG